MYLSILCHVIYHPSISKTFWVIGKNLYSFQFAATLMSLRVGMVIFQEKNLSFKWVVFAKSLELVRCSHEKWIKNHTETVYLENFHADCELLLVKVLKKLSFFKYILFSKQKKAVFWGEMATNGRKDIFILTKTLVVNKYMLY